MKVLPIPFSAPMAAALWAGQKTQTRRLHSPGKPPRYQVGQRLYVREPWRVSAIHNDTAPSDLPFRQLTIFYEAGGSLANQDFVGDWRPVDWPGPNELPDWVGRFRQGMHLPRWATRMTAVVENVRIVRLADISEEDAIAEGVYRVDPTDEDIADGCTPDDFVYMARGVPTGYGPTPERRRADQWWPTARLAYRAIWDHLNGKGSFDATDLVEAYTLRVIRQNIDCERGEPVEGLPDRLVRSLLRDAGLAEATDA